MEDIGILEALLNFVCKNFVVNESEIVRDESLIDQGVIDSLGLIEIISFIEKQFPIKVREDQMIKENFGSIDKIAKFIYSSLNKGEQQSAESITLVAEQLWISKKM